MIVRLHVDGRPAPQGSWRRGARGQVIAASRHLADWREVVAVTARQHRPTVAGRRVAFAGPVLVELRFELRRPLTHYIGGKPGAGLRPHTLGAYPRRPDLDKLIRATLDAMVEGGLLDDDSQVVDLAASKVYSSAPGCSIMVEGVAP